MNLRVVYVAGLIRLQAIAFSMYFTLSTESLISQHTVAIFYLHGPIPFIKILIKDNTVIVFIWSYYATQGSKRFENF